MPSNKLIKNSHVTEKASLLRGGNKYVFNVDLKANKNEIKKDLEKTHKVNVISVNIIRNGRRKKAIVGLKEGQVINEKI
jgi:large subunit ribosomal protein L23